MKKTKSIQKKLINFSSLHQDKILPKLHFFESTVLYSELEKALGKKFKKKMEYISSRMEGIVEKNLIWLMQHYREFDWERALLLFEFYLLDDYEMLEEENFRGKWKRSNLPRGEDLLDECIGYYFKLEEFKDNYRNALEREKALCKLLPEFPPDEIKNWNTKCIKMPRISSDMTNEINSLDPFAKLFPKKAMLINVKEKLIKTNEYKDYSSLDKMSFLCHILAYKYKVSPHTVRKEFSIAFKLLAPLPNL